MHEKVRSYFEKRAQIAEDPRSTTLNRLPPWLAEKGVVWGQQWLFERLDREAVGRRRALDLGCGNGDWTLRLARELDEVTGVDGCKGFVDHLRERVRREGLANVELFHGDLLEWDQQGGTYDLIVLGAVVQYLTEDEVEDIFRRVGEWLAPNGLAYVRTTVPYFKARIVNASDDYLAYYRKPGFYRSAFGQAGLEVVDESAGHEYVSQAAVSDLFGVAMFSRLNRTMAWPVGQIVRLGFLTEQVQPYAWIVRRSWK